MTRTALLVCAAASAATPACAQDSTIAYDAMSLYAGSIPIETEGKLLMEQAAPGRTARAAPAPARTSAEPALRFAASAERRQAFLRRFADAAARSDSQHAAETRAALRVDPIAAMAPDLAAAGLRIDDLADAYTVWWINSWQAAHGDRSTPTREQAQAVRAQAARALLASPALAAAGDEDKQALADSLLLQGLLAASGLEQAQGDAERMRALGRSVRASARAHGVDLDRVRLTPGGFAAAVATP